MSISIQSNQVGDREVVFYIGPINEDAEVHLSNLSQRLSAKCTFNFRQVSSVNSCGVRAWINFMREISKTRDIIFEECTPEIVMQINMIPSFKANAKIHSVYGSYICENCSHEMQHLFVQGQNLPKSEGEEAAPLSCPKCNTVMEMQELEDEFFAFNRAA